MRHVEHALRLHVAVRVVGEHHQPIADVVVDGVDFLLRAIERHGGDEHHAGRRTANAGERFHLVAVLRRGEPIVGPQRVAIGIAEEHLVALRVDDHAVERRVGIADDAYRRHVAAGHGGALPPGRPRRRRRGVLIVEAAVLALEREQRRFVDRRGDPRFPVGKRTDHAVGIRRRAMVRQTENHQRENDTRHATHTALCV